MRICAVDFSAPDREEAFVRSLRETGFGVLAGHPIPADLVEAIYADWTAFFASESKHEFAFDPERQDGYFSRAVAEAAKGFEDRDIKEYFHFYTWGRCPQALRGRLMEYYERASAVAAELLGWVERQSPREVAAGYSESLSTMIDGSDQTLLRVLRYPPLQGDEPGTALRAAPHEDINLLTLLPAADAPGLEVMCRDGNWWTVPCDPGHLIINVGDMLQEASGGWLPSTRHRVINPSGAERRRARMSLPLFLHPRPDVVLSPRYTAGEYLAQRLRELRVV